MSTPVIIIGATGGVGSALARTLAGRGVDLHLIGRDEARTADLAATQGASHASADVREEPALAALGRSLAAEWAPHVRVNVITPSLTRTPLAAPLLASEQMAQGIAAMHPIPRLGEADDQASAASFLLSPEAGWITGQVLGVDGGRGVLRTKG